MTGAGHPSIQEVTLPAPHSVAVVKSLALDAAAAELSAALSARGVDVVLLKGAGLARRLGHPRTYHDVDLLVAPAAFGAAQQVLADLGCVPVLPGTRSAGWPDWHERQWRTPGAVPLKVDLHHGFAGVGDADRFWSAVWTGREQIDIGGRQVAVPDRVCAALLVALHAANPGRSVKPLVDLARAVEALDEPVWRAAAEVAQTCRATSAFALGLRQTDRGNALARRLGLPRAAPAAQVLAARGGSSTAYVLLRLAGLPTMRARVRQVGRRSVPSLGEVRQAVAGRRLRFLTRVYLTRAGRYLARLPRALVELRGARWLGRSLQRGDTHYFLTATPVRRHRWQLGRIRRDVPTAVRVLRRQGVPGLRAALWAARGVRRVRQQLRSANLDAVRLGPPPSGCRNRAVVVAVLRRLDATCLERSLLLQRWYAANGEQRTLVIGVTAPSRGFHAHAWLQGELDDRPAGMVELLRRTPPPHWSTGASDPSDQAVSREVVEERLDIG